MELHSKLGGQCAESQSQICYSFRAECLDMNYDNFSMCIVHWIDIIMRLVETQFIVLSELLHSKAARFFLLQHRKD